MLGYLQWKASCKSFLWSVCWLQDYISKPCFLITVNTRTEEFGGEKIGYFFVVLIRAGFWCLLFSSVSARALLATPPRSPKLWDLHMHRVPSPTSPFPEQIHPPGLTPSPAEVGQGATQTHHPATNIAMPHCLIMSLASKAGNSHFSFPKGHPPMRLSRQRWQTSEAKAPGGNSRKMSQHHGAEQRCPRYL